VSILNENVIVKKFCQALITGGEKTHVPANCPDPELIYLNELKAEWLNSDGNTNFDASCPGVRGTNFCRDNCIFHGETNNRVKFEEIGGLLFSK